MAECRSGGGSKPGDSLLFFGGFISNGQGQLFRDEDRHHVRDPRDTMRKLEAERWDKDPSCPGLSSTVLAQKRWNRVYADNILLLEAQNILKAADGEIDAGERVRGLVLSGNMSAILGRCWARGYRLLLQVRPSLA